jgi:hypothetical protein
MGQDREPPSQERIGGGIFSSIDRLISGNLSRLSIASRSIVIVSTLASLVAVAACVGFMTGTAQTATLAAAFSVLVAALFLLYRIESKTLTYGPNARLRRAISPTLHGWWWQLVFEGTSINATMKVQGLTTVKFRPSNDSEAILIEGRRWTESGAPFADWSTDRAMVASVDPLSIFYYWSGAVVGSSEVVTGVGVFEFVHSVKSGTGWFTTGDVRRGDFSIISQVYLVPATTKEARMLEAGDIHRLRPMIATRYAALAGAYAKTGLQRDNGH